MNEAASALVSGLTDLDGLFAQVKALRGNAATRPDPVRLQYIEALARRLQVASPAVQKVLQAKLAEALQALGGKVSADALTRPVPESQANEVKLALEVRPQAAEGQAPRPRKSRAKVQPEAAPSNAPLSLLGQLNQHIQAVSSPPDAAGSGPQGLAQTHPQDLKSAIRFRETWARISAETAVDQAAHRAPENAGPLNAHNLVLRTLSLMRECSPDYLRRFMSHTESLMWLDQAYGQLKQPAGKAKAVKVGKTKK